MDVWNPRLFLFNFVLFIEIVDGALIVKYITLVNICSSLDYFWNKWRVKDNSVINILPLMILQTSIINKHNSF